MVTKNLGLGKSLGAFLTVLLLGLIFAAALNVSAGAKTLAVTVGDGIDQHAFEDSEDIYVEGLGWFCSDNSGLNKVDIFITLDRDWSDGDLVKDADILEQFMNEKLESDGSFKVKWSASETTPGKYDVLVECHNTPDNKKKSYDPGMGDLVDGVSILGFEVLPEAGSLVLLCFGLVSLTGYFAYSSKP